MAQIRQFIRGFIIHGCVQFVVIIANVHISLQNTGIHEIIKHLMDELAEIGNNKFCVFDDLLCLSIKQTYM